MKMVELSFGEWPRRHSMDHLTPTELEICKMIRTIENMGADVKITKIVVKLSEIRDILADYLEEKDLV